jgi:5-oxoprolinase (ATP-hydrolysing) subunit C
MRPALLAVAPTAFVTLQDAGRLGWQRFGVSRSGAMDAEALAIANALVGNAADVAALEFAHAAGEWEVGAISCRVAVTGGRFSVFVDEVPAPAFTTITLTRGQTLRIGGAPDAVWGYLAVAGGFDLPPQLGSLATHCRSGIGGVGGRPVQAGDALPLATEWVRAEPERSLREPPMPRDTPLRVVLGPQDDYFTPAALATFLSADYSVTHQMDRLGYRLSGPLLAHAKGWNIISDGYVAGSIQVPGSGEPIVLLVDAQPPGGYPKIATIVTADLARLAQSRPGSTVRFEAVAIEAAQRLRREFVERVATIKDGIAEVTRRGTGVRRV